MILTLTNIAEWKKELDEKMSRLHDLDNFSNTIGDEDWIESYLGKDTDDAIDDEVDQWEGE